MAASPYNLRTKLNAQGITLKSTSAVSPLPKQTPRSPQKSNGQASSLNLRTVIGTTTEAQTGIACHPDSDTFVFCAGSTVVLGKVDATGQVTQRFFRAPPTIGAVNPIFSFYDESAAGATPENRRRTGLPTRSGGFSVGSSGSPRRDWNDDHNSKPWTAKDRVKATSTVSLTINGRFLAVGETGYCPRVLIFSTNNDSSVDLPLSIITEHSFGVRAVAFSQDSRYLATLGDANDGFLFIWSFDSRTGAVKLHSTNKCTANICDMAWCGDSLITVGTRHVKVWRIPERLRTSPTKPRGRRLEGGSFTSPSPQALLGRNCLLGSLADSTFTCVTAISSHEAVVCTDRGQVCIIEGTNNSQEIKVSRQLNFSIYAVTARSNTGKILFGGVDGALHYEEVETLRCLARPARRPSSGPESLASYAASPVLFSPCDSPSRIPKRRHHRITALGWLANNIVSIDSTYNIHLLSDDKVEGLTSIRTFESHHDQVQGLSLLPGKCDLGAFFTWSPSGKLKFWDIGGKLRHSKSIEIEQLHDEVDDVPNELRVVQVSASAEHFVCGDKLGVLKIIKSSDWSVLHETRAHGAELTDIAVYDHSGMSLITSCGRDRVVQLFAIRYGPLKDGVTGSPNSSLCESSPNGLRLEISAGSLELLQTMDDHVGAVGHVIFTSQGERLLSCSADRTVIVRDRVTRQSGTATSIAYISSRIITLKSSPISMATISGEKDSLVVSTMDRQILRLNAASGTHVESFKASDGEADETAIMNCIQVSREASSKCPRLLVGSCSIDKSIRIYDYDQGILLTRESGHTEGISGLALTEEEDPETGEMNRTIISTGLDGTIMIWNLTVQPPQPPSTPLQELSQGQALEFHDSIGTPSRAPAALRPPLRKVLSKTDLGDFSFFDRITKSLTPLRDESPPRIRKKTSRHSLAPNKLGLTDSPSLPPLKQSTTEGDQRGQTDQVRNRSPSPPAIPKQSQRSKQRFPSPSPPIPKSMPSTPSSKTAQRANNARLRRPPSIPSDLHLQTSASRGRRKSLTPTAGNTTDPAAASASQNLSRSLRGYRKKISAAAAEQAKEQLQLEEVETELLATLESVREAKKAKAKTRAGSTGGGSGRRAKAKAATESDLESLAKLMETTSIS
jgi:WD40 repeat protein